MAATMSSSTLRYIVWAVTFLGLMSTVTLGAPVTPATLTPGETPSATQIADRPIGDQKTVTSTTDHPSSMKFSVSLQADDTDKGTEGDSQNSVPEGKSQESVTSASVTASFTSSSVAQISTSNTDSDSSLEDPPEDTETSEGGIVSESDVVPNSVRGLAKKCVSLMTFAVAQAEAAFEQMCSRSWCQRNYYNDVETCRASVKQTALTLFGLPSLDSVTDHLQQNTLFTHLQVVYNITSHCTSDVGRQMMSEYSEDVQCSRPESVSADMAVYCTLRAVYLAFEDLRNHLKTMMVSLHGPFPEPQFVTPSVVTNPVEGYSVVLLAAASQEMTKAQEVMTQYVLTQL